MADDTLEQRVLRPFRTGIKEQIAAVGIFPADWEELVTRKEEAFEVLHSILEKGAGLSIDETGVTRIKYVSAKTVLDRLRFGFCDRPVERRCVTFYLQATSMNSQDYAQALKQSILATMKILYLFTYPSGGDCRLWIIGAYENPRLDSPVLCDALSLFIAWHLRWTTKPIGAMVLIGVDISQECQAQLWNVRHLTFWWCRLQAGLAPPSSETQIHTTRVTIKSSSDLFSSEDVGAFVNFLGCLTTLVHFGICCVGRVDNISGVVHRLLETFRGKLMHFEIEIDSGLHLPGTVPMLIDQVLATCPNLKQLDLRETKPCYRLYAARGIWARYGTQIEERVSRNHILEKFRFATLLPRKNTLLPLKISYLSPTMKAILCRNRKLCKFRECFLKNGMDGHNPKLLGVLLGKCSAWPAVLYEVLCQSSNVLFPSDSNNDNPPRKRHKLV